MRTAVPKDMHGMPEDVATLFPGFQPSSRKTMPQPSDHADHRRLEVAILEDDDALREDILMPALTDYGFRVTGACSARELYRLMLDHRFDLIVLDLGLPDEDGISVAAHLRETGNMGLLMLTASREKRDRIQALQESVDAFLTKPVDLDILAATLHSLARRLQLNPEPAPTPCSPAPPQGPRLPWRLEANGWLLVAPDGQSIALTTPERDVLVSLMDTTGKPVSREDLIKVLTRNVYDFDPHRLEMMVHRLRRKVEKQAGQPLPLLTVRGTGYLFATES